MNLFAVGALGLALVARQGVGFDPAIQERHIQESILERRLALQELLLELEPEAREHALAPLAALKTRGVPTLHSPPIDAMAQAWHLARGDSLPNDEEEDRRRVLQRVADSLALRVVPCAFNVEEASEATRGEPVTVFVTPLAALALRCESECRIALHWIAPEGGPNAGEEILARREPVDPAALKTGGFEMYVHAPTGPAGLWSLVVELEAGAERVRGIPVPVEGIADLPARLEALKGEARAQIGTRLATGWRGPQGVSLSEFFAGELPPAQPFSPADLELPAGRLLALEPSSPPDERRDTLIVLASPGEPPSWTLAGQSGRAWLSFAERMGVRVLATDLPVAPGAPGASAAEGVREPGLGDLLRALEKLEPDGRRVLLARGSALSRLALALRRGFEGELAGVIQSTYLGPGARPSALLSVPTLFVQVLAEEEGVSEEGELTWIRCREAPLLADPELPERVAEWWSQVR